MSRRLQVWIAATLATSVGVQTKAAVLHVPGDQPSISAAVAAAHAGDEIDVAAGTYSPSTTGESFPIRLSGKSLRIHGAGALRTRLDAERSGRHFMFLSNDSSRVEDLALIEGWTEDGGGAVLVDGASPTLIRLVFAACEASRDGDVLRVHRGSPQVVNCLFSGNGARGPTVCLESGEPTFERCTWATNAGAALELRGPVRAGIRHSVVASPGVPSGRSVGVVIVAAGEDSGPDLVDNLFGECTDGAIRVEGEASVELAAMLEVARQARGLRSAELRFVDGTRGDFRLVPGATFDRDVGAFSGSAPLRSPPVPFEGKDDDKEPDVLLGPSVPNPFAPRTTIHFNVPAPSVVDLGVYNVLGQRVRTLHAGDLGAGEHTREWDGRDDRGEDLPPGIYFVRITIGDVTESRRLVLVR